MGWIMMGSVGALFGGLLLGFRDLVPYLAARQSGVIVRKGSQGVRIRRDEDPGGFERLLANRSKGAATGFGMSMIGAVVLSLFWLAMSGFSGPLAILIFVVYVGLSLFAIYCLVQGFLTGRMFAFWGFTLFGEADRRSNPTWFWGYAVLNGVSVLAGISTVLRAISGG